MGTANISWLTMSGGVTNAATIIIMSMAYFLYFFKKAEDVIPILAKKYIRIGSSKSNPVPIASMVISPTIFWKVGKLPISPLMVNEVKKFIEIGART